MPQTMVVAFTGFAVAAGLPLYYVVKKQRAASSLRTLLSERFSARQYPISEIRTKGGPVRFYEAYNDNAGTGLVLLLAKWRRSRTAYNLVAGLVKPGGDVAFIERMRSQPEVLLATAVDGGALVVWKGLPSRASVLTHLEAMR